MALILFVCKSTCVIDLFLVEPTDVVTLFLFVDKSTDKLVYV